MCEFPSWITDATGKIWFCTDADVEAHEERVGNNRAIDWRDYVGHSGVRKIWGDIGEAHGELFPCPPEIADAIMSGRMRQIMLASGIREIWVNEEGLLHRASDKPAVVCADGTQVWYQRGFLHRAGDKPAVVWPDGSQEWYQRGFLHRAGDKPAVVWPDGKQEWYQRGLLHRAGDKPAVVCADGTQVWYQRGLLHRAGDKPAVVWPDGSQEWYQQGKRYRANDKPAVIWANGKQPQKKGNEK